MNPRLYVDDETPIELLHECPNCWVLHQVPGQLCYACEQDEAAA